MRVLSVIFAFSFTVIPLMDYAASVDWNKAFILWCGESWNETYDCDFGLGSPYLWMHGKKIEKGLEVFAEPSSNLQNANSFYLSFFGDMIDESDFDGSGRYFSYTTGGENGVERTDYSIILLEHKNQYLAYRSIVPDGVFYGWVELGLNDDGEVIVFSSAQSASYDGLAVGFGPLPEPSCVLLSLLGGALLVMRRRCRMENGAPSKARHELVG